MRLPVVGLLSALTLFAQQNPWAPHDSAFNHYYNLEYNQAIAELVKGLAGDPNSVALHNYLAQSIQCR